jgi:cell division protein ZapA (FtsZ GTPase activity inhibitor)
MKEKLPINIKIEGRQYPVVIDRNDEEKYRKAAGQLNEIISRYRNMYRNEDSQNILAMAAFGIMLKGLEIGENADHALFIDEVKNIRDDIADFLEEKR